MKFQLIWYDMDGEKGRDTIEASSKEEAEKKGYKKYNGNPPGKMVTILEK